MGARSGMEVKHELERRSRYMISELNQYALKDAFCREEWDKNDWAILDDQTGLVR